VRLAHIFALVANIASQPAEPLLVNEHTAAGMLSLSIPTLRRLRASGELPYCRIGAAVRYRVEDLREWVAQRTRRTQAPPQEPLATLRLVGGCG
jgi:excisionase family DNA binding protein